MTAVDVVVMAAGKGTRMKSATPKVLHRLGGRPLIQHVMDTAQALQARRVIVITGHGADALEGWLRDAPLAECARRANACGALVVSRHGCAPKPAPPLANSALRMQTVMVT